MSTGQQRRFQQAILQLRMLYNQRNSQMQIILNDRNEVLARYQPLFSLANIPQLSADEFKSFLKAKNNKRWSNLLRYGERICQDMADLRRDLLAFLDESQPIERRWDAVRTRGFGKNTRSAILLVMYPAEYGVWNNASEDALKRLGIWPSFSRGVRNGKRYKEINQLLLTLAQELEVDLWTLDLLLWDVTPRSSGNVVP